MNTPGNGDFATAIDSLRHLNVRREVRHAIARGDTRLLAIDVARIPGLPDSSVVTARDRLGFRTIPWTSDVVAGGEWERWQVLAAAFAARYNAYLWRTINQQ
ncbi:MAG: hypothetical protein IPG75_10080 [Gemmatimonadetes bacterium]|nr:hypothetical protein [Gemmatimonadota bacterium]